MARETTPGPLVEIAALLGWTVIVADGRAQLATARALSRAPNACCSYPPPALRSISARDDAVILMTHSYEQDRDLLAAVLPLEPALSRVCWDRATAAACWLPRPRPSSGEQSPPAASGVFAPVGMDLGGDGPETIALAIVAEVQAVATGRIPVSRRLTAADVAEQIEQGGASRYLQAQCALEA